jgi:ubiquinone/menaquinone biosynthesis C-methylase UbiE
VTEPSHRKVHGAGGVLHRAALYDVLVQIVTLGRERRLRTATLDRAGVASGSRVLDVGCGTGTLTLEAKRRAGPMGTVRGLDASPEMIARAKSKATKARLEVGFELASATALPVADESYDVVLCSLALHHLPRAARAAAVGEMYRALAAGGRLVIVEFARAVGWRAALNPIALVHRRGGDMAREAEGLLRDAGFVELRSDRLHVGNLKFVVGTKPAQHV